MKRFCPLMLRLIAIGGMLASTACVQAQGNPGWDSVSMPVSQVRDMGPTAGIF